MTHGTATHEAIHKPFFCPHVFVSIHFPSCGFVSVNFSATQNLQPFMNGLNSSKFISLCALLIFAAPGRAQTSTLKYLPFQGRLADAVGKPISDGVRLVQFRIYDAPSAGNSVWSGEIHRTTVNGGLINVVLGSKASFAGVDFNRTLYLEMAADANGDNQISSEDPALLPRQAILPAIFANESADSRKLQGSDWSAILEAGNDPGAGFIKGAKLAPGSVRAAQIADQAVTPNKIVPGSIDISLLAKQVIEALNPPGTIVAFGGETNKIPQLAPGWLLCDGRPLSSQQYSQLYSAIGTNWGAGAGTGTDFSLPDLRGMFLRGVSGARADGYQDPNVSARTNAIPLTMLSEGRLKGGNLGNKVGSVQPDEFKSHTHTETRYLDVTPPQANRATPAGDDAGRLETVDTGRAGGSETRPKSAYVHYLIKY